MKQGKQLRSSNKHTNWHDLGEFVDERLALNFSLKTEGDIEEAV
jgi:hypothetical protein